MSIKKRICNRIAASVAACGDPKLEGAFLGASDAVRAMDGDTKAWYERREIAISERYVAARQRLAAECEAEIDELNAKLFARVGA